MPLSAPTVSQTPPNPANRADTVLSMVIPTYNERERLAELVRAICQVYRDHRINGEVVIVDDNSPDGTGAEAERLALEYPVRVIHRSGKLGLGTAVIEGFARAQSPIVGVMDGDLSHPPALLPQMLSVLLDEPVDFVVGSRYVPGGGCRDWALVRRLLSRIACVLARPVTPVRDATSGFFLVRKPAATNVQLEAGGFKICLELLVRGHATSVAEVPYVFVGREVGKSKMNVAEAVGYFKQLADLCTYRYLGNGKGKRLTYRRILPATPSLIPPRTA